MCVLFAFDLPEIFLSLTFYHGTISVIFICPIPVFENIPKRLNWKEIVRARNWEEEGREKRGRGKEKARWRIL
jgi:hypothetical protein